MQEWGYIPMPRQRGWKKEEKQPLWHATNRSISISGYEENMLYALPAKLGQDGWELGSIAPRSHYLGAIEDWVPGTTNPRVAAYALEYAGLTSEESWVFKCPSS
jgi:hypothetical protein